MVSNTTYLQVRVDLNFLTVDMYRGIGGVLPAVPSYNGSTDPPPPDNTGVAFAGGLVPTNLVTHGDVQGLDQAFTLRQQGLTADVTCQTNSSLNPSVSSYTIPVHSADGTLEYQLWGWIFEVNCGQGECAIHRA